MLDKLDVAIDLFFPAMIVLRNRIGIRRNVTSLVVSIFSAIGIWSLFAVIINIINIDNGLAGLNQAVNEFVNFSTDTAENSLFGFLGAILGGLFAQMVRMLNRDYFDVDNEGL